MNSSSGFWSVQLSSRYSLPFSLSILLWKVIQVTVCTVGLWLCGVKTNHCVTIPSYLTHIFSILESNLINPPAPLLPLLFAVSLSVVNLFSCMSTYIIINPIPLISAQKGTQFNMFLLMCCVLHLEQFGGVWGGVALSVLQFAFRHLPCLIKAFPLLKDSKKLCKKEQVRCFFWSWQVESRPPH